MGGGDRLREVGALRRRMDRRTVLKGAAVAGALGLIGGNLARRAGAQDAATTRAGTWVESDNPTPRGSVAAASVDTSRTFQSDFTFYAIAPNWSGDGDPASLVQISYSGDGNSWSNPITVGAATGDAGPPDRGGRTFGQLIVTPGGGNFVKYEALDADGDPTKLPDLAFTYIDASGGPSVADIGPAATDPQLAPPPVISRADWGCDESLGLDAQGNLIWPPEYQTVEHVIVHHSDAGVDNFYDPLLLIRSIYYYHTVTRGWGDIGYNYLVDFMGHIYEGRKGGENVVGGHAYQYAHGSSGICCMGTFMTQEETPEALSGLTWITAWTGRKLDPYGHADFHEQANLPTICGHRDVLTTTCPGDMLEADLDSLRDKVSAVLEGADPSQHPQFNVGDAVVVSVDQANVRSSPGTGYGVVKTLDLGTTLTVTDGPTTNGDYTWYEVTGSNVDGWIASTLIAPQNTNGGTPKFKSGDAIVTTDRLNLRSSAGTDANIVATMPTGTTGTVSDGPQTASGYTWYKLDTSLGSGWAVQDYLDVASSAPPPKGKFVVGNLVVVSTDRLNLRSTPSLSGDVVAVLTNGAQGSVVDGPKAADGYTWYKLDMPAGTGWSVDAYLDMASPPPPPPSNGKFKIGDIVVVSTDSLNLRQSAGLNGAIVARMPSGTQGTVTDGPTSADGYAWYELNTTVGTGWSADAYLELSSNPPTNKFAVGDLVTVDTDRLNLRGAPTLSANVVATMPTGTPLTVTDGPTSADGYTWWAVKNDTYGSGWSVEDYLALSTPSASSSGGNDAITVGGQAKVIDGRLNMRASAALSADVVAVLPDATQLDVLYGPVSADGYDWYQVRNSTYGTGWCVAQYLAPA